MNALPQNLSAAGALNATALAEIASMRARLATLQAELIAGSSVGGPGAFHRLWIDRVAGLVATEWGMHVDDMRGCSREKRFTRPRFVWVWLVKQIGHFTNMRCAGECGYVDHTSVIWACRRVEGWREQHADFRLVTDQLLEIGRTIRAPGLAAPAAAPAEAAEAGQ